MLGVIRLLVANGGVVVISAMGKALGRGVSQRKSRR